MKRQQTGKLAERMAREYLEKEGYSIIATNWRCPEAEIDIIAQKDGETVFVEVRAKSSADFGTPAESITRRKQEKLIAAAGRYMSEIADAATDWRIDFIGVEFLSGGHRLEHIPHAVGGAE
jgi:putative endonuclease